MKEDDRIITSSMREEDIKNDYSLRPKFLSEYIALPPSPGENPWTTPCCMALRASARPRWRASSPTRWA